MSARKRERQEIVLELDVLVERLWHADRHLRGGGDLRCLGRDLEPALDLPDVLHIFVDPAAVAGAHGNAEPGEALGQ